MNQEQEEQSKESQPPVTQPVTTLPQPKKRKTLAILLLVGPTALIFLAVIGSAIANFAFGSTPTDEAANLVKNVINIILFLFSTIGLIAWLPGIIIGIILLAKKK